MSLQPLLIDGAWQPADEPSDTFQTDNSNTGETLSERYPVSRFAELDHMVEAGREASVELRDSDPEAMADFLEAYANSLEERSEELVKHAHQETGLATSPRLAGVELPRMTDQLRQAAAEARNRTWQMATIDAENNIRSRFEPLGGPVVVMGPNNFPFAFNGISGGDFAAAIAAGNPVIAKAHPAHPTTTRIAAEAALDALQQSDLPEATVQLFYHTGPDAGRRLVAHPQVGATAFTGSKQAGLSLKEAADEAGNPIYLEMSSVNPVFMLPGALEERGSALADELAGSCTMGEGQFCTNPGLVVLPEGEAAETFTQDLQSALEEIDEGPLLTTGGPQHIDEAIAVWQEHGAEVICGGQPLGGPAPRYENTLLRVSGETFLEHADALQTEAFGAVSLLVFADRTEQMVAIAGQVEGNLTGAIYSHTGDVDEDAYAQIEPVLRERVGRLLNDQMPTGVAVSPAMVHGGPYPSTGHPGFTAVGTPASLRRFAAKRCYDNVRSRRLPPELRDENPTGEMWRLIGRDWTQQDVG
jgi:NADP-dependent aldehyde dehydrogenase